MSDLDGSPLTGDPLSGDVLALVAAIRPVRVLGLHPAPRPGHPGPAATRTMPAPDDAADDEA